MEPLRRFFRKYGWRYIPGVIFLALSSWIQTLGPMALGNAIDLLEGEDPQLEAVFTQAGWIVLIALGTFVTRFIWRHYIIGNARNLEVSLREDLFAKLQSLPVSFFNEHKTGDLMAYAINDVGAVRMTFGPATSMMLTGVGVGTFTVLSMGVAVPAKLMIWALLPLPVAIAAVYFIGKQVRRRFTRVQELFSAISGRIQESISGMRTLKAFAREEEEIDAFAPQNEEMQNANIQLADVSSLLNPIIQVIFGISFLTTLGLGGNMVYRGEISLGDFVAFHSYLTMIMSPIISIGRIINLLQRGMASYKRLNAIFELPSIPDFESGEMPAQDIDGAIQVRNLHFSYSGTGPEVLSDISFTLEKGKVLGIVGPIGSGKSTLISVLTKEYPVEEGQVFFGGKDIRAIPAKALRETIGIVPQDSFLFGCSIEENIQFYQPGATHEDVLQAAHLSGLDRDLAQFPQGWKTIVGERGSHLSGGQNQRVAIARALIRKPSLLILDDCLSAVDTGTEAAILENLKTQMEGTTAIIITHRLSAVLSADEILYMDEGRITERGTHAQLMELDGDYAKLYRQQSNQEGEEAGI